MTTRTFKEAMIESDRIAQSAADRRPFNLLVGNILVTRKEVGGRYFAYDGGREYEAISDGGSGFGDDGRFHFSLEDNPLG